MSNSSNMQSSDVSATVREAFNFSVDKFPLFGPDNMKTDQYGLFRSDTGYIDNVKSISGRYVPHTTDDVCALVDAASTLFDGEVECKTHWNKGHYVSVAPTKDCVRRSTARAITFSHGLLFVADLTGRVFMARWATGVTLAIISR